jgi:ATP-binding cassette subfamily G (WHITE) protein 2 (PDR)
VLSNIVVKVITLVPFSIVIYFLSNLRAEPGPFFIFFLFNFVAALTMSIIFRTVAASTKTLPQAHTLAGVIVLAVIIYTGYIIPRPSMHPWFKWISWINPVAYSFESLLLNEMHHRKFPCARYVFSFKWRFEG